MRDLNKVENRVLTLADADDGVRREGRLVIVHVHDVDAQGGSARELRSALVSGDHGETV